VPASRAQARAAGKLADLCWERRFIVSSRSFFWDLQDPQNGTVARME
jgi:hypothetical protein